MKSIKNIGIPATIVALLFSLTIFAQQASSGNQTASFNVSGNCESCKKRIETAALKTKGVQTATWNADTQQITISYDSTKTSPQQVGERIAKVGHDNQYGTAISGDYSKLPACCKYPREKK